MNDNFKELKGCIFDIKTLGFVRIVDYLGGDESIVEAARVSYSGGKTTRDTRGLLRYLMRHEHSSPFEFASIVLHIKAPLFVARQWYRHRTAKVNEISGRYVTLTHGHYVPPELYLRSTSNKQGRSADKLEPRSECEFLGKMNRVMDDSASVYHEMIEAGVAPELARIALPMGTHIEWYWKMDLRNLLHFLRLRLHQTAQKEIQEYAKCIAKIVKEWAPLSWEAFEDYTLNAVLLSVAAYKQLKAHLQGKEVSYEQSEMSKGEWREFMEFLESQKQDDANKTIQ